MRAARDAVTAGELFKQAMRQSGLAPGDVSKLTGVDRCTVWRWTNGKTPVPQYAWTVVEQQQRIRSLAEAACNGSVKFHMKP